MQIRILKCIVLTLMIKFTCFHIMAQAVVSEENPKEDVNARSLFRLRQREALYSPIAMDALEKAKVHNKNMPISKDAGIWNWEWLGPGNIGGRIRAILIHPTNPSTIWIGGVAGGIWKTTNAGASWSPMSDFISNLAITSIVMDPTNYNILYASTGEGFFNSDGLSGGGIFKSTDGGNSWNLIPGTNIDNFKWINRMVHHPTDANVLFIASSTGGIYKSTDAGISWTKKYTPSGYSMDIKIHPTSTNKILIGTSNNAYLSTNTGTSWTKLSTGAAYKIPTDCERCEVAFAESDANIMYIACGRNKGEIYRSDDGGVKWEQQSTGTEYMRDQQIYNNTIWVCPTNPYFVVVGGIDIWRSTSGGKNLSKISRWQDYHNGGAHNSAHADNHIIVSESGFNGVNNKRVYFGNDGGIQMTNDIVTVSENSGWVNLANNLGITQFYGGAASQTDSRIVGGTQDNDVLRYHSTAGQNNWYQNKTGDGGYCAIDYTNQDIIYSEYVYLAIDKSTNGGSTYTRKTNQLSDAGDKNTALFIAPFVMDPNNPSYLVAGGNSIWQTSDGAENWYRIRPTAFNTPKCSAIEVAKGNSNLIWVGYDNGEVAMTYNGGTNWFVVGKGTLPAHYVTDIAINPINNKEAIVTFGGYDTNNIWITRSSGDYWTKITGTGSNKLPAIQINTVRYHPNNTNWIYIGTDLGVYASEDSGQHWNVMSRYDTNEGPCNVEVDELFWQGDYLLAATHGRGMYRCLPLEYIYVRLNAAAGGNGSQAHPYNNFREAITNAGNGATIVIEGGTYNEVPPDILMDKNLKFIINNGPVKIE